MSPALLELRPDLFRKLISVNGLVFAVSVFRRTRRGKARGLSCRTPGMSALCDLLPYSLLFIIHYSLLHFVTFSLQPSILFQKLFTICTCRKEYGPPSVTRSAQELFSISQSIWLVEKKTDKITWKKTKKV